MCAQLSWHGAHPATSSLYDLGVVSWKFRVQLSRCVCRRDRLSRESLRGLHRNQGSAVDGLMYKTFWIDTLDGVGQGERWYDRITGAVNLVDDPLEQLSAREGAGRIVHEDGVDGLWERVDTEPDRLMAFSAARNDSDGPRGISLLDAPNEIERLGGAILGHDNDEVAGVRQRRCDRDPELDERAAPELDKCFGYCGPEALASTRRHEHNTECW